MAERARPQYLSLMLSYRMSDGSLADPAEQPLRDNFQQEIAIEQLHYEDSMHAMQHGC